MLGGTCSECGSESGSECGSESYVQFQKINTGDTKETISTAAASRSGSAYSMYSDSEAENDSDSSDEDIQETSLKGNRWLNWKAAQATQSSLVISTTSNSEGQASPEKRKPNAGSLVDVDDWRDETGFALTDGIAHASDKAGYAIAIETSDGKHRLRQEVLSRSADNTRDCDPSDPANILGDPRDVANIPGRQRMPIDAFDEDNCFNFDGIDMAIMSEFPAEKQCFLKSNLPSQRTSNRCPQNDRDTKFSMKRIANCDRLRRADDKGNRRNIISLCDSQQNGEPHHSDYSDCDRNRLTRFRKFRSDSRHLAQSGVAHEDDSRPPLIPVKPSTPFESSRFRRPSRKCFLKREQAP